MTHRGPFQALLFCDSVILQLQNRIFYSCLIYKKMFSVTYLRKKNWEQTLDYCF